MQVTRLWAWPALTPPPPPSRPPGPRWQLGTLDDLDVLQKNAEQSDGVIHLAFKHDIAFTGDFEGAATADRQAVEVFGEALAGSDRPLVIASGVLGLSPGHVATEARRHVHDAARRAMPAGPAGPLGHRRVRPFPGRPGRALLDRAPLPDLSRRRRQRLHGHPGRHRPGQGCLGVRRRRVQSLAGQSTGSTPPTSSAWLSRRPRPESTLHGVAEEGVKIRDVAEVIGRHLDVPVVSIAPEDAEHFSFLAHFIGLDSPASSTLTRNLLGWEPTHVGLIEDLDQGHYYAQPSA